MNIYNTFSEMFKRFYLTLGIVIQKVTVTSPHHDTVIHDDILIGLCVDRSCFLHV